MRHGPRTVVILLLASAMTSTPAGRAYAEGLPASEEAPPVRIAWPTTVIGEGAFRPSLGIAPTFALAPRWLVAAATPLPARLAAPSLQEVRLTRGEKIILIVAACVVGVLLVFATVKIASHNHPF